MMAKQQLHVTEFSALCCCQIDFMLADDKPEGALSWFEMWKEAYPDDPQLEKYEDRIALIGTKKKLKNATKSASRRRKKKAK